LRAIGVVTTSRADYSYYVPLLRAIESESGLRLQLIVSGMHLCPEFGMTVKAIEADGFPIASRVHVLLGSDAPQAIAKSMGMGVIGFGQAFAELQPDILVVFGDRFEMHAAALAALPFRIPTAHISGGDVTEGAIDDALRHSLTKLCHLHFVATDEQAQRVRQMGEEDWRVTVTGALSLDAMRTTPRMTAQEFRDRFGVNTEVPFLLVTYHPVTLEFEDAQRQIDALLSALDAVGMAVLFTAPNADTGGQVVAAALRQYVAAHSNSWLVDSLGQVGYFSAMELATAMVGNSSSGIIEAVSFGLPVVNIGTRQRGRMRGKNILDCDSARESIEAATRTALSAEFRSAMRDMENPWGGGDAAARIVERLKTVEIGDSLVRKRFIDRRQRD
jgi:UDP-hydrolysing UDP-N-acetyl-D-glucosamine 2-epimerase